MKYFLDTNILLIYLRDSKTKNFIEKKYHPLDFPNIPIISVVSVGEIKSLALRNSWGLKRIEALTKFLNELIIADINSKDVIENMLK